MLLGSSPDGNEQRAFNDMAIEVGNRFPGQSGFIFAYDEPLSHLVYAAADMLLAGEKASSLHFTHTYSTLSTWAQPRRTRVLFYIYFILNWRWTRR